MLSGGCHLGSLKEALRRTRCRFLARIRHCLLHSIVFSFTLAQQQTLFPPVFSIQFDSNISYTDKSEYKTPNKRRTALLKITSLRKLLLSCSTLLSSAPYFGHIPLGKHGYCYRFNSLLFASNMKGQIRNLIPF